MPLAKRAEDIISPAYPVNFFLFQVKVTSLFSGIRRMGCLVMRFKVMLFAFNFQKTEARRQKTD
jgi:hypothetical protein